jgi:pyrroline-5-carboxylate reductase
MKTFNLGVIGCGNMARAIIGRLASGGMDGFLKREGARLLISVSDSDADQLKKIEDRGYKNVTTLLDNAALVKASDFVLLAVKPQSFADAVKYLNFTDKTLISIMAGVSVNKLCAVTAAQKIVRVMPNLNAQIGESFNAYCPRGLSESEEAFVNALLGGFGAAVKVEERMLNAVTGVAGSGPAFVFMFIDAFISAAEGYGFSPFEARQAALTTIIGSARHIERSPDADIGALINSVCSKGGTTIEGVNFLRESDFESTVKTAIDRAVRRAGELERNL